MRDACGDGNGLYLVSMSMPACAVVLQFSKALSTGYLDKEDTDVSVTSVFLLTTVNELTIILIKNLKYKDQYYYSRLIF